MNRRPKAPGTTAKYRPPLLRKSSCDDPSTENSGKNSQRPASIHHHSAEPMLCGEKGKMSETWIEITPTPVEDGYSWRKYGQKEMPIAKYPRSFFRCKHRHDQGCLATKQIQKTEHETPTYHTTYIGHHTCQDVLKAPQFPKDVIESSGPTSVMENSNRPASIDHPREGYTRRGIPLSWTKMTREVVDDGYVWRKYGQKEILNAKYPRNYFRCTHRNVEGCLATKQIQKTDDEPPMYRTTYWNHHTCRQDVLNAPPLVMDEILFGVAFLLSLKSDQSGSTSVLPSTSGSDYGDVSGMYSYTSCSHSSFDMDMDSMDWFC